MLIVLLATAAGPFLPDLPWGLAAVIGSALVTTIGVLWKLIAKISVKNEGLLREKLDADKAQAVIDTEATGALAALRDELRELRLAVDAVRDRVGDGDRRAP